MRVPADITTRKAQVMATRAAGRSTASDAPPKPPNPTEDPTPGNEEIYRGIPCYYDGRLPMGGTIAGTRPGNSTRWLSEIETDVPRQTC